MSLLTGDRTVADVIAGNRCFVLLIPQDVFNSRIVIHPKAVMYLSRLLAERTRAYAVDITSSQLHANAVTKADDPYALSLRSDIAGQDPGAQCRPLPDPLRRLRHRRTRAGTCTASSMDLSRPGGAGEPGRRRHGHPPRASGRSPLADCFAVLFDELQALDDNFQFMPQDVIAVGHRVVHGGSKFSNSIVITPQVMADIEALSVLAPFHNPINLEGIRAAMKFFPAVPHVAVFDTAFHQTLPPYAYLYGLPYDYYKKEGIRRYGFHGTSHRYVSLQVGGSR